MTDLTKGLSIGLFLGFIIAHFFDEIVAAIYRAWYRRSIRAQRPRSRDEDN